MISRNYSQENERLIRNQYEIFVAFLLVYMRRIFDIFIYEKLRVW